MKAEANHRPKVDHRPIIGPRWTIGQWADAGVHPSRLIGCPYRPDGQETVDDGRRFSPPRKRDASANCQQQQRPLALSELTRVNFDAIGVASNHNRPIPFRIVHNQVR